jgi:hypothetical protein
MDISEPNVIMDIFRPELSNELADMVPQHLALFDLVRCQCVSVT